MKCSTSLINILLHFLECKFNLVTCGIAIACSLKSTCESKSEHLSQSVETFV